MPGRSRFGCIRETNEHRKLHFLFRFVAHDASWEWGEVGVPTEYRTTRWGVPSIWPYIGGGVVRMQCGRRRSAGPTKKDRLPKSSKKILMAQSCGVLLELQKPDHDDDDGEGSYVPSRIASFYASLRAPKACT